MKILKISTHNIQNKFRQTISQFHINRKIGCDIFESSKIKLIPPNDKNLVIFFNNRNADLTKLYRSDYDKFLAELIRNYRKNDSSSVKLINSMKELYQSDNVDFLNSENNYIRRIGLIFFFNCCKFRQKDFVKYNPLDYYRIFRTIGESEYKALLEGQHIVAPSCNNESVMVTNRPTGVPSCTHGSKRYFVKYKDKPNFDPLAPQFYSLEENKIPNITSHNIESAEYYLEGGYNIEDIKSITDLTSDIIVYKEK